MKLREVAAPDFDLEKTLDSGQVFHWEKCGRGFAGAIGEAAVYVEQQGDSLLVGSAQSELDRLNRSSLCGAVAHYFALDHRLAAICRSLPRDPTMKAARGFCRGLRIIRQPKWECLATFICSSMKQVAHIRQISRALRTRFGQPKKIVDLVVHTFPSAQRLAASSEKELRRCALGYRAKNLLATARLVAKGDVDLDAWQKLSDEELREKLCELPGVGAKVANCVMLFAYERLRAFPIDVWIARTLEEKYFAGKRKPTEAQLRIFAANYFGDHGGYAQQYLFHHARKTTPRRKSSARGRTARARKLSAPRR